MTGSAQGQPGEGSGLAFGLLDSETADCIDIHLERALDADDDKQKDFHVRHARQLLEAAQE